MNYYAHVHNLISARGIIEGHLLAKIAVLQEQVLTEKNTVVNRTVVPESIDDLVDSMHAWHRQLEVMHDVISLHTSMKSLHYSSSF